MRAGSYKPMKFDDLTAVYREEKTKSLLTAVRLDLYPAMCDLISTLKIEYEKTLSDDPDSIMSEGANQRRRNAVRIVRDITEMRMRKINSLALRSSGGSQVSVDMLTGEEKEYYDALVSAAGSHLSAVDRKTERIRYEVSRIDVPRQPAPAKMPETLRDMPVIDDYPDGPDFEDMPMDDVPETVPDIIRNVAEPVPDVAETGKNVTESVCPEGMVLIRVLEDLPAFAGPDRDYNLKKEDLATIPKVMADALVNVNKAVIVRPSP